MAKITKTPAQGRSAGPEFGNTKPTGEAVAGGPELRWTLSYPPAPEKRAAWILEDIAYKAPEVRQAVLREHLVRSFWEYFQATAAGSSSAPSDYPEPSCSATYGQLQCCKRPGHGPLHVGASGLSWQEGEAPPEGSSHALSPLERELLEALREIRTVVYSSGFTAPELLHTRFKQIDLLASDAIAAAEGK